MTSQKLGSFSAALGLALTPLSSEAKVIRIPACGGGTHILAVPANGDLPGDDGGECAKACHAVTDRRSKTPGQKGDCC